MVPDAYLLTGATAATMATASAVGVFATDWLYRDNALVTATFRGQDVVAHEVMARPSKYDPLAVLPIHQRLVENELVEADAQHYRLAARRLAKMRKLAAGVRSGGRGR